MTLISGKLPVLFTAPHSVIHLRSNLAGRVRPAEQYTDVLSRDLAESYQAFALYPQGELDYDPNYSQIEANPYLKALKDVVDQYDIKAVIDLHGLDNQHNYDLAIYYPLRFRNSKQMAYNLAKYLDNGSIKGLSTQIFNSPMRGGENNYSVSEYTTSVLRIPAVQLEIAGYLRSDQRLRDGFIKNLASILSQY